METMSINETLKKILKYYPARPFMTVDVLRLYEDDGYDITNSLVINNVSRHLWRLSKQHYLRVIETIRIGGVKNVYMVRQ